jgi:hypothetical protein
MNALSDPEATVRATAVLVLGHLGDEQALATLAHVARDASPLVRAAAVTAIGRLGEEARVREARALAEHAVALEAREQYRRVELELATGFHYALSEGLIKTDDVTRFVENHVLRPIGETFAVVLGERYSTSADVELGIAHQTGSSVAFSHASGPFTRELKREGPIFVGDAGIWQLLERRVFAHFSGDWYSIALAASEPRQYLVAVSSATLGAAERSSLEYHAALIRLMMSALSTHHVESS